MEHQWQDIKTAYRRILNTTFQSEQERDYAHITLLRLGATVIDLMLSGDEILRTAILNILGDNRLYQGNNNGNSTSIENESNNNSERDGGNFNGGNLGNLGLRDVNNFINNAEALFNRTGLNVSNGNANISASELRNMFPIFHYMFEDVSPNGNGNGNNGNGNNGNGTNV